jgi:hypothetical protein
MHKSATKCNETLGKWCKNKHGASKIIDTLETYLRTTTRRHTRQDHLAVTIVLGTEVVVDDLDRHHQNSMGAQSMEEPEDLDLQIESMAMKMMKKRWEHRALLAEFAPRQYPKDSNYLTTNKSTTGHKSHSHGSRITCKQYKYWEEPKKQLCKVCNFTSPAQQGHG